MQRWESAPATGWNRVLLKLSGEAFSGGTGLEVSIPTSSHRSRSRSPKWSPTVGRWLS